MNKKEKIKLDFKLEALIGEIYNYIDKEKIETFHLIVNKNGSEVYTVKNKEYNDV